jgi:hypothetical protein
METIRFDLIQFRHTIRRNTSRADRFELSGANSRESDFDKPTKPVRKQRIERMLYVHNEQKPRHYWTF